jgi:tight adherence protein C
MTLTLIVFSTAFLLTSSLGALLFGRKKAPRRLSQMAPAPRDPILFRPEAPDAGTRIERLVKPFQSLLPRNPQEVSAVRRRLTAAGLREDSWVNIFYGCRLMIPLLFCAMALVTRIYTIAPVFVFLLATGLGFLAPDYWIGNRIAARRLKLRLGLPEALDLIVICVEAGLSIDKATMRAAEELKISQPAIADELNLIYLEQRAGCPRADAWKHLGERTGVDTLHSLASVLIQADKFGTSIGRTLRTHSDSLRTQRRQQAEEQAAKTTVKLVFPLVLLIFPSLIVVLLGPSMLQMLEGFKVFLS